MASSLNLKGLTIEIGGDVSNLQTALKSVNGEITNLQANLRTVESALKLDPSNVDALAQKQKLLSEAVTQTAEKLQLLQEAQRQADEVIQSGGEVDEQAYRNLQSEIVRTQSSLSDYESQLQSVNGQLSDSQSETESLTSTISEQEAEVQRLKDQYVEACLKYGETSDEAKQLAENIRDQSSELAENKSKLEDAQTAADSFDESMKNVGQDGSSAINDIAQALAAAGIAKMLQEAGEAVYQLADSYSNATSNIVEGTGASGDALKGLQDSLYNVYYRVTDSEASLESVGNVLAEVNTRLGLTGTSLEDTSVLISEFAEHTGVDAVQAVDMVVDIMKKWGLTVDDMPTLLDGLTVANQSCSLSMDEIGRLLIDNKAQFDALGYSVPEATALIVALADSGVNTSSVLTGMRNAINTLSKTTDDVPGAFNAMIAAIANCDNATDALNMEVGNTGKTVKEVFGAKAAQEMVTAIQSGNFAIEDWMKVLRNCDGALATTAENANTLQDRWATATRNISGAFSQALTPVIEQVSGKFADLALKLGQFLQAHPGVVRAISAIAAAFGTLLGIASVITIVQKVIGVFQALSGVITVVKAVGTAISGLFTILAANPIGLVIAAIAALAAVFVTLYNKCEWFRNAVNAVWNGIKSGVMSAVSGIQAAWSGVVGVLSSVWNGLRGTATSIWNGISSAIVGVWNGLRGTASSIWNGITGAIGGAINGARSAIVSVWNGISSAIVGVWNGLRSTASSAWNGIKGAIVSVWNAVRSTASSVWNGITSAIVGTINSAKSKITSTWNAIKSAVVNVWNGIKSTASSVWNGISTAITNTINTLKSKITSVWNAIKSAIQNVWNGIKSAASSVWNAISTTITNVINGLKTKITGVWNSITSTLTGIWNNIKSKAVSAFQNISSSIVSTLQNLPRQLLSIGQNIVAGLWNGIADKGRWLLDQIKGFGRSVIDGLKGVFGIHSPSTVTEWMGEMFDEGLWKGIAGKQRWLEGKLGGFSDDLTSNLASLSSMDVGFNGMSAANNISRAGAFGSQAEDHLSDVSEKLDAIMNYLRIPKSVYIDKRKLVGAIADDIDDAIGEIASRKAVGSV